MAVELSTFKEGQMVKWTSGAAGSRIEKTGRVAKVVSPRQMVRAAEFPGPSL